MEAEQKASDTAAELLSIKKQVLPMIQLGPYSAALVSSAPCSTAQSLPPAGMQVDVLKKEKAAVTGHLTAAQAARGAAQRAAVQLKHENAALAAAQSQVCELTE